jgi:starch-binding outer membrane protein, SusD/RagB family
MKILKLNIIFIIILASLMSSCEKVLDKTNLGTVSEDLVWDDVNLADAFVSRIYDRNLPTWNRGLSGRSDESNGGEAYMYGQLTETSVNNWQYSQIREINILLDNIDGGNIEQEDKDRMKGEAYFFRAWVYFDMIRDHGGVPLILNKLTLDDDLYPSRAKTSEVMEQIITDIDQAINLLPEISASSGSNNGRVHKGTAMAIKGRILMYYASPQFNPGQINDRWQTSYNANKAAKDYLVSQGFGLYGDFPNIWMQEMNKEVIFVSRYEYPLKPEPTQWAAATRPLDVSTGRSGGNQPSWEMVQAFPMKDGKNIEDPTSSYVYDVNYYWLNRDPRFYHTIVYNGARYELGMEGRIPGRIQWTWGGSEMNSPTQTGFYCRKAIDVNAAATFAFDSNVDFVSLRFAEVLLNLAESANKVGNTDEAYEQLIALRVRAGIEPGPNNNFGLAEGMNEDQMNEAILHERQIELAFENHRYWDLRRNRLFENKFNGTRRHGLYSELIVTANELYALQESMSATALIDHLSTNYTEYFRDSVMVIDNQFDINWKPEYYFYAIHPDHIELNTNLKQTQGWSGGSFDPLE